MKDCETSYVISIYWFYIPNKDSNSEARIWLSPNALYPANKTVLSNQWHPTTVSS